MAHCTMAYFSVLTVYCLVHLSTKAKLSKLTTADRITLTYSRWSGHSEPGGPLVVYSVMLACLLISIIDATSYVDSI